MSELGAQGAAGLSNVELFGKAILVKQATFNSRVYTQGQPDVEIKSYYQMVDITH